MEEEQPFKEGFIAERLFARCGVNPGGNIVSWQHSTVVSKKQQLRRRKGGKEEGRESMVTPVSLTSTRDAGEILYIKAGFNAGLGCLIGTIGLLNGQNWRLVELLELEQISRRVVLFEEGHNSLLTRKGI